ncbi:unnamed protein product [Prunus armeniaca]|uniref:Retrovirus-related Pol polyprotein from transposon TNT 1-94-like beta-barrel domain-containing protein n=1 Tax=Prunus armeniaca TaxID=36596 RepID=A0A6J5TW74_PRUAR|nr:unnamed protein product [Prunus armeniaca]
MSVDELHSSLLVHEQKLKSQNTTIKEIALKAPPAMNPHHGKALVMVEVEVEQEEEGEVLMILAAEEIMISTTEENLILEVESEVNTNNKDIMSQNLKNHRLSAIGVVGTVTIGLNATLTCLKKGVRHQNLNKEMKKFFLLLAIQKRNHIPIGGILTQEVAIVYVGVSLIFIIYIDGKSDIQIKAKDNFLQTISNVYYALALKTNFLSIGQLQEKGYVITIKEGTCEISDPRR